MERITCRIKENSTIARIAAWRMKSSQMAIVFGHTIHLHGVSRERFLSNIGWVRHEVCHVKQYRDNGYWGFLWYYVGDWIRVGYYANRFEKAARLAESNVRELDGVEIT